MVEPGTETPESSTPTHDVTDSSSQPRTSSSKRARGRPTGSKNKPKLPLLINHRNELAQKPVFIQIPRNSDVIEAIVKFAREYQTSITVQSASGSILYATLRNSQSSTSSFIVHGPFTLVSLSGTCINNTPSVGSSSSSSSSNLDLRCSFRISISSNSGQSFIGVVGGKVIAGDDVHVAATFFNNNSRNYEEGDNNHLNNVI